MIRWLSLAVAGLAACASWAQDIPIIGLTCEPVDLSAPDEHGGLLLREIARQAFLISARDELGTATRDQSIGESTAAATATFRLVGHARMDAFWRLTVGRAGGNPAQEIRSWSMILENHDWRNYPQIVDLAERLLAHDFVDVLHQEGINGVVFNDDPPVGTASLDSVHEQFAIPTLFALLHNLHLDRRRNESPQRLDALATAYANLGFATRFQWTAAHQAYVARSLLYAQRRYRLAPDAMALCVRAYARALAGMPVDADDDVQAAARLQPDLPEWAETIKAFIDCDFDALRRISAKESGSQVLATVLLVTALGQADQDDWWSREASAALRQHPDWWFLADDLSASDPSAPLGWREIEATDFRAATDRAVQSMADLPSDVAVVARASTGSVASHLAVRSALKASESLTSACEPTWSALDALIAETDFVFTWRRRASGPPNDITTGDEWPGVTDHRYASLLKSLNSATASHPDEKKSEEKVANLVDAQGYALAFLPLLEAKSQRTVLAEIQRHRDHTSFDQLAALRASTKDTRAKAVNPVFSVFPASQAAWAVFYDGINDDSAPRPTFWQGRARMHPVLLKALARRYVAANRPGEAEACLLAVVESSPSCSVCERISECRRSMSDHYGWVAALRKAAACVDATKTDRARIRSVLADYFKKLQDWKQAAQEAESAAATGDPGAAVSAAECRTRSGEYDLAEKHWRRLVAQHPRYALEWYWWCLRTAQGNVADARGAATGYLATPPEVVIDQQRGAGLMHQLDGESNKAREAFLACYQATHDPTDGLMLALLNLQMDGSAACAAQLVANENNLHLAQAQFDPPLIGVQRWMNQRLNEPDVPLDLNPIEDYAEVSGNPAFIWYLVARFLGLNGDAGTANRLLDRSIALHTGGAIEAHAVLILRQRGITVGSLLQNDRDGRGGDF